MAEPTVGHDLARKAATDLAQRPGFPAELPIEVEKQILQGDAGQQPPEQMPLGVAESIALAAFLLSCAEFAWQVWKDGRPEPEVAKRTLRLEVKAPSRLTVTQRDQVIEVVVAQLETER